VIVLDVSVLIGYLDASDAHHDRAATLLMRECLSQSLSRKSYWWRAAIRMMVRHPYGMGR
jgi:predicted nucleic acid-binding protein